MLISTKGRYALRVLIDLAEHQTDEYVPLKEVADRQEISEKYLESILKALVKDGILIGLRGKRGGYRLSKSPDSFSVYRVLKVVENSLAPVACLEDTAAPCARMSDCRTLSLWQGLDQAVAEYLSRYTISDLMQVGQPGNDYII